ncbi:dTDP-4-dehydrorhamnose reductase [Thermotomaculum hydrothermale]|uniref:dTDP-4-dehydrorhamnose reductase n=1 Tax=Thermotomaculum hydrothermale TaxID=981385 RepID=A0A7R6PQD3_9BACT|nr:dTDP-4-dehydrorhamnose reductase [Thermotomaculum hydrothermale]BBB33411.1 dTDP-4-dehydrorhamnose reductase [Thermotomaculum hydrothermale]
MGKGLQKAKIIITGKNGQLAKEFIKLLSLKNINFFAFDKKQLDISDFNKVNTVLKEINPDFVINCAAYNFVDKAEEERKKAYSVNTIGVENLAKVCRGIKCKIVHYSTDYVFDGNKKALYIEKDIPNPLNYYGKTKLEGEKKIKEICENFLIFRVSWVYGEGGNNFVAKFLNWAKKNKNLKVSENEVSIPTYAKTIAKKSLKAIEEGLTGLFHLTNSGYASRYQWALKIKEYLNLSNNIEPVNSSIFNLKAKRPEFSAMDNSFISKSLGIDIPQWDKDLKKYLEEIE